MMPKYRNAVRHICIKMAPVVFVFYFIYIDCFFIVFFFICLFNPSLCEVKGVKFASFTKTKETESKERVWGQTTYVYEAYFLDLVGAQV